MAFLISLVFHLGMTLSAANPGSGSLGAGSQPQLSLAPNGTVRLAFGRSDSIFCSSSQDGGDHFSEPELVGVVKGMHLGMTRGPQIASSGHFTVITAMDKEGNIHLFRQHQPGSPWQSAGLLNDRPQSAPEGLMAIAANEQDQFFAVWLDTRKDQHNNIYFASSRGGTKWTPNRLVYASPDGHVCECCKPSIAAHGQTVAIMFRNWLGGARDLYCSRSDNGGAEFAPAVKLGKGSWPLEGCPMDGGAITIDQQGKIHTTWRRENELFYCQPGMPEQAIGKGRLCGISISRQGSPMVSLQQDGEVWVYSIASRTLRSAGRGAFLKTLALPGGGLLCTWENNNQVNYQHLPN
jgi:hypothetical protein